MQDPTYLDKITREINEKNTPKEGSQAMLVPEKGGIDLTPARMNLETKTDSRLPLQGGGWRGKDKGVVGIKLRIDPALLKQLQNTSGFSPVIVRMQSTTDIQGFLGIDNSL